MSENIVYFNFRNLLLVALFAVGLTGCEKAPAPEFRLNRVKMLEQERSLLPDGEHFDESYHTEISSILTALFGTPDEPEFPFLTGEEDPAHDIVSLENLKMAAGPVLSDREGGHGGLYREHCAHCHGVTGGGAGPTASILNPYPRDFRLGKFKFKSTPLRKAPTDHDLENILIKGIPGTAMPSFRTLPPEEIDALVDYVKYLTIRGEFERYLISEVGSLDGRSIIDYSLIMAADGEEVSEDDREEFEEQIYAIIGDGLLDAVLDRWHDREDSVSEVPPAPVSFAQGHPQHIELVKQGQELFFSKGNCLQCHGETAAGDGQLNNYDDWTNDWFNAPGIDKFEPATYQEFIDAGALPPRTIRPRNLHLAVYRGGDQPNDLYLRLANGIEGSPMPASSSLTSDEIWAMVAYVKSLPFQESPSVLPVNEKQIAR